VLHDVCRVRLLLLAEDRIAREDRRHDPGREPCLFRGQQLRVVAGAGVAVWLFARRARELLRGRDSVLPRHTVRRPDLQWCILRPALRAEPGVFPHRARRRGRTRPRDGGRLVKYAAVIEYLQDKAVVDAARPAHRAYLTSLVEQNKLFASGPFEDGSGALIIYEADSPDAVAAIMK